MVEKRRIVELLFSYCIRVLFLRQIRPRNYAYPVCELERAIECPRLELQITECRILEREYVFTRSMNYARATKSNV